MSNSHTEICRCPAVEQMRRAYADYLAKRDQEWADYLKKEWAAYEAFKGEPMPQEAPKPQEIPAVRPGQDELPAMPLVLEPLPEEERDEDEQPAPKVLPTALTPPVIDATPGNVSQDKARADNPRDMSDDEFKAPMELEDNPMLRSLDNTDSQPAAENSRPTMSPGPKARPPRACLPKPGPKTSPPRHNPKPCRYSPFASPPKPRVPPVWST